MKKALSTLAAIAVIGCGQNDNNETLPRIDSGPTLPDTGHFDMAQDMMADTRADLDAALDANFTDMAQDTGFDASDSSDAEPDTGPVFTGTNISIEATDYDSAIAAGEQVMVDPNGEYYMSVYGLGSYPGPATETQAQRPGDQPSLKEEVLIQGPNGEVPTGSIADNLFCLLPGEDQLSFGDIREPDVPFSSCESTATSCDLSLKVNGLNAANSADIVVRLIFECPESSIPEVDGVQAVQSDFDETIFVSDHPIKKDYIIQPGGCTIDRYSAVALSCESVRKSLYSGEYPSYRSQTFPTSLILR